MRFTPDQIAGFTAKFLIDRYDDPLPIPRFHRELWGLCCSDYQKVAIVSPRNHGKAQPLSERVLTPTGWTTIGKLTVGTEVIGRNGNVTKVTYLHPITTLPIYEVVTKSGASAKCNEDHLWEVIVPSNQKDIKQILSLKQIKKLYNGKRKNGYQEYRVFLTPPKPVEFYKENSLVVDSYTLGVWLGDGSKEGGLITSADPEIFKYIPYKSTKRNCDKYGYRLEGLTTDLSKLGVLKNKHIPEEYLFGLVEQRLSLLQGLLDTDGSIHQDGKIAYFYNTNRNLIDGVVELTRGLGGIAKAYDKITHLNGVAFNSWVVSIKLPKELCPFKLSRKVSKWVGASSLNQPIVDVRYCGEQDARCITVENKDGLYITNDYLVTHNSTAITHAFVLAACLFREKRHIVIVSETESQAIDFLNDIKLELVENTDLINVFGVRRLTKDSATDIIVEFTDGAKFRVRAIGSEQKVRGRKWGGSRPDLIVCDDIEGDEQVESDLRREKFRSWFFKALVPSLSDRGHIRVVGTILHLDSLLYRLCFPPKNDRQTIKSPWQFKFYKAHEGFDNFSNILWPEKWPEERLRSVRDENITAGMPEAYSQEYLNNPIDQAEAFFRKSDFLEMEPSHFSLYKNYYGAIDFAISDSDKADYTVIVIGGMDQFGTLHIVDVNRFRGDMDEIFLNMMAAQQKYSVELWKAEEGVIKKTLFGELQRRMVDRNIMLNISPGVPTKDKRTRARPLQARMRAGGVRFNKDADWYPGYEEEFLHFPKGAKKDQVDATAWLAIAIGELNDAASEADIAEEDYYSMVQQSEYDYGRNPDTGY